MREIQIRGVTFLVTEEHYRSYWTLNQLTQADDYFWYSESIREEYCPWEFQA